ncbi:MAG: ABC transporter ATP-binding protein [Promethearchaeota archaeon]
MTESIDESNLNRNKGGSDEEPNRVENSTMKTSNLSGERGNESDMMAGAREVAVEFKDVTKIYSGSNIKVLDAISFKIYKGEFMILVGPSGCGKSTCLRMLAGLEEVTSGEIIINGRVVNDLPPKDRNITMVFQSYALFPHMTIYDNLAFGLKIKKVKREVIDKKVKEIAEMLGLTEHLNKKPGQLSGGQRQRVALGRAIAREASVFLLDEPLSNLDAKLRAKMRAEIKRIQRKFDIATLYVTHDQIEAMTMGDRIIILNAGKIQQIGSPDEIYNYPSNKFVAGFIGTPSMNFFNLRVMSKISEASKIELGNDAFRYELNSYIISKIFPNILSLLEKDYELILGIRPEHIKIKETGSVEENNNGRYIKAIIELIEPIGPYDILHLRVSDYEIICQVSASSYKIGQELLIEFPPEKIHLFDKVSELSILKRP